MFITSCGSIFPRDTPAIEAFLSTSNTIEMSERFIKENYLFSARNTARTVRISCAVSSPHRKRSPSSVRLAHSLSVSRSWAFSLDENHELPKSVSSSSIASLASIGFSAISRTASAKVCSRAFSRKTNCSRSAPVLLHARSSACSAFKSSKALSCARRS